MKLFILKTVPILSVVFYQLAVRLQFKAGLSHAGIVINQYIVYIFYVNWLWRNRMSSQLNHKSFASNAKLS